jgi:magnesium transporter
MLVGSMVEEDVDIGKLFDDEHEDALRAYLQLLHATDVAQLFNLIKPSRWLQIASILSAERLADVLTHLEEHQVEILGDILNTERLIEAVDELETDDATDVLHDLSDAKSAVILSGLEDKADIATLLAYPEDCAGGIMQTEVCTVLENQSITDAIESVRQAREDIYDVFEIFVVDEAGHLRGTVALEDLILSDADTPIRDVLSPLDTQVTVNVDQEEVAQLFKKFDLTILAVTDPKGTLLGRITFDDVHDVMEEEASEDIMTMAGASSEDMVYSGEFVRIALFRLPWLLSSLLGSLVTTQLVPMFSSIPGDTIILAAFVPVVMAMTGNLGSQSAMIITRGFAIGKVEFKTLGRTFMRESSVALIMGVAAGSVVAIFAHIVYANSLLGLALGLSMLCSMILASLVGTAGPALFKHLGIDPAIAAGPLVTTACDVLGVSIYLLVALLILS